MNNPKFTPGNWSVESGGYSVVTDYVSDDARTYGYGCENDFICDLNDGEYHEYIAEEEQLANAHLIAAAPCMYEELQNAVNMCQSIMNGYGNPDIDHKDFRVQVAKWADDFLNDAKKALAKAEGKDNE